MFDAPNTSLSVTVSPAKIGAAARSRRSRWGPGTPSAVETCVEVGACPVAGSVPVIDRVVVSPRAPSTHVLSRMTFARLRVLVNVHVIVVPAASGSGTVNEPLVPLAGLGVTPLSQARVEA